MGVGVNNADHFQAQRIEARQDQLMVAARVDDDGFFGDGVADDRAVALQRAYRERFADQRGRLNIHGYSCKFKGKLFCTAFRRTVCSTLHPIRKRSRAHGCQTRQLLSYSGASHTTRNV